MQQKRPTQVQGPAPSIEPYRLKDGLGYKLSRAARVMQSAVDDVVKPLGLTRLSWTVLASIGFDGIHAPGSIARHIGIERTVVSRILRKLEADGLIERHPDEHDGRGFRIGLSVAGAEICDCVPGRLTQAIAPLRNRLSAEQVQTLAKMLDVISQTDDPVWDSEGG